jgi:hypothetical protein
MVQFETLARRSLHTCILWEVFMRLVSTLTLLSMTLAAPALEAQRPYIGFGLNLAVPVGGFRSSSYPMGTLPETYEQEGYDAGLGAQFTVSIPLDPVVAFRVELAGQSVTGTNTLAGYETIHLRHELFGISGQVQIFPALGAMRHKGFYLLGGLSADFERFDRSYDSNWEHNDYYDDYTTERASRMGGLVGFGHAFGYNGGGRFTWEVAFHKTLSGHDQAKQEPIAADYLRLGVGFVF